MRVPPRRVLEKNSRRSARSSHPLIMAVQPAPADSANWGNTQPRQTTPVSFRRTRGSRRSCAVDRSSRPRAQCLKAVHLSVQSERAPKAQHPGVPLGREPHLLAERRGEVRSGESSAFAQQGDRHGAAAVLQARGGPSYLDARAGRPREACRERERDNTTLAGQALVGIESRDKRGSGGPRQQSARPHGKRLPHGKLPDQGPDEVDC